jgi:hypothetical protein
MGGRENWEFCVSCGILKLCVGMWWLMIMINGVLVVSWDKLVSVENTVRK